MRDSPSYRSAEYDVGTSIRALISPASLVSGELSAAMLYDAGARAVILGHSERRHVFGESDAMITEKVKIALRAKLEVMLCVGETLEEREAGRTFDVLARQLKALKVVKEVQIDRVSVAYEPVWAIGTGRTASPEQAQEVHAFARERIAKRFGEAADSIRIQYGGSVKPDNVAELMGKPDIDGALVGGASLEPESFSRIVQFDRG